MRTGLLRITFTTLLGLLTVISAARAATPIDSLLEAKQAPAGVVFEIATSRDDGLARLLPTVKAYISRIHKRFPDLPIAVVSHGREMFALQKSSDKTSAPAKQLAQQLVKDGVNLHVCGTYASHKGLSEEDFPGFVNVAAAGPAQINDYIAVGYLHIRVKKPLPNLQLD